MEIPTVYDGQVSGADQATERSPRTEQNFIDDLFRRGDLSVSVMPGHLHELENVSHCTKGCLVASEGGDNPRLPLAESFSATDRHVGIIALGQELLAWARSDRCAAGSSTGHSMPRVVSTASAYSSAGMTSPMRSDWR